MDSLYDPANAPSVTVGALAEFYADIACQREPHYTIQHGPQTIDSDTPDPKEFIGMCAESRLLLRFLKFSNPDPEFASRAEKAISIILNLEKMAGFYMDN